MKISAKYKRIQLCIKLTTIWCKSAYEQSDTMTMKISAKDDNMHNYVVNYALKSSKSSELDL